MIYWYLHKSFLHADVSSSKLDCCWRHVKYLGWLSWFKKMIEPAIKHRFLKTRKRVWRIFAAEAEWKLYIVSSSGHWFGQTSGLSEIKSGQFSMVFVSRLIAKAPFVIRKLLRENDKALSIYFGTANVKPTERRRSSMAATSVMF